MIKMNSYPVDLSLGFIKKVDHFLPALLYNRALSYYKVSQKIFLVDHFLYRYMITVAGVERSRPWDSIPSIKQFA
ncbi:hypothetical protein, partial [Metabacillus rhizolycopersici]